MTANFPDKSLWPRHRKF